MERRCSPFFPLERVKFLARQQKGLLLQRTRARNPLVERTGSVSAAYYLARVVVERLDERDFSETQELSTDTADVYGVWIESEGWYLKLTVDEAQREVAIISLHPLERPMKTQGGTVYPDGSTRKT